ncbi:uncharacterized protein BX664DRAFT_289846 [Halteromyces radiatus]|uniref:uncharacterized protein n=1 Tax=Halteromyces radiatus TaxID=101107 RepID=UPI002220C967|nr:uncharacterized protein BX664DRAFT_289846 [Halteromyces radiatus]KAI8099633.1 hypothetical protein BX664DRAFT_289846 [Halteromyces radiatus]
MNKRSVKDDVTLSRAPKQNKTSSYSTNEVKASWQHYFEDGRQAFATSQYKEAVDYFTRAINLQPSHITLLDSRSAALEKLKDWEAAIKDAKAVVKLSPCVSKGYLRLGKLLCLQQRFSLALQAYRRGCEKVTTTDTRYPLLVSLKSDMENKIKLNSQKMHGQRDPIKILPYDVLDLIFTQLPFHRRVACMQVSKHWQRFLLGWSGMWRDMDFITGATKHNAVSRHTLKRYFSYNCGRHLRRFSLSANNTKTDYALQLLVNQGCQYVEYLGLADTKFDLMVFNRALRLIGNHLTHLYLDGCGHALNHIYLQLSTLCPNLTHFYYESTPEPTRFESQDRALFRDIPNNKHLKRLYLVTDMTLEDVDLVLLSCPNLTHLILPRTLDILEHRLRIQSLPHLQLYHVGTLLSPKLYTWQPYALDDNESSRKGLSEFTVMHSILKDEEFLPIIEAHRTTLGVINLSYSRLNSNAWCSLLTSVPGCPLRELYLDDCIDLSEQDLCDLIHHLPQLQVASVAFSFVLTNTVLDAFSQLVHLERLNVSGSRQITGSGLRHLVDQRQTTLKKLQLNDCTSILPDAIDYARAILGQRAVECSFGNRRRR